MKRQSREQIRELMHKAYELFENGQSKRDAMKAVGLAQATFDRHWYVHYQTEPAKVAAKVKTALVDAVHKHAPTTPHKTFELTNALSNNICILIGDADKIAQILERTQL